MYDQMPQPFEIYCIFQGRALLYHSVSKFDHHAEAMEDVGRNLPFLFKDLCVQGGTQFEGDMDGQVGEFDLVLLH